jgi:LysM repeat protein
MALPKKYNISIEAIRAANTGLEDGLIEGMEIIIPDFESTNKKTEPQTKTYENGGQGKPEKGYFEFQERNHETIYELAIRYRVSVDSILFLNPGLGEQLSKGEIIKIISSMWCGYYLFFREFAICCCCFESSSSFR